MSVEAIKSNPLLEQGHLKKVAQDHVPRTFKYLQGGRFMTTCSSDGGCGRTLCWPLKWPNATMCCKKSPANLCTANACLLAIFSLPIPFPSSCLSCPSLHRISFSVFSLEKPFVWHVRRLVGSILSHVVVHEKARQGLLRYSNIYCRSVL